LSTPILHSYSTSHVTTLKEWSERSLRLPNYTHFIKHKIVLLLLFVENVATRPKIKILQNIYKKIG